MAVGSRNLAGRKHQSASRLRQSMSGEIDVERLPDDGNIDLIRADWRGGETQISQGDPWRIINDLVQHCQVGIYHTEFVQVVVVVFQGQPVLLRRQVNLMVGTASFGQAILGGESIT